MNSRVFLFFFVEINCTYGHCHWAYVFFEHHMDQTNPTCSTSTSIPWALSCLESTKFSSNKFHPCIQRGSGSHSTWFHLPKEGGNKIWMTNFISDDHFFFALKQEENLCLVNQPRFQFISMMNQVRNWPWWDVDGLAVKWCLAKRFKMAQPRTPVVSCLMKIVSPKDFLFVMKYRYLVWRPPCSSGENYHRFGDVYLYKCAFELQLTVYHFKFPLSYSIFCNTCSSRSLVPSHSFIFPQFCGMIFPIWLYLKINQHVQMVHFW